MTESGEQGTGQEEFCCLWVVPGDQNLTGDEGQNTVFGKLQIQSTHNEILSVKLT